MKAQAAALFFLVGWLSTGHHASAQELPMFGQLPIPGKNWKVREQGKSDDLPVPWAVPWAWIVLTNSESGDVLSFAAHKLGPRGGKLDLIYLSDTAREIFPAGDPEWVSTRKQDFNPYTIRSSVVRLNLLDSANKRDLSQNALEYTFVHEEREGRNRMAHGYALYFGDVAVFVQHTATKPITSDLAYDIAVALISSHSRQEPAAKPQTRKQEQLPKAVSTVLGADSTTQSNRNFSLEASIVVTNSSQYLLKMKLTWLSTNQAEIFHEWLPWGSDASMELIAVETRYPGGVILPRAIRMEHPGGLPKHTLTKGGSLEGTIVLNSDFLELTNALNRGDVIIFWSYLMRITEDNLPERVGGWFLIPKKN